MEPNDIFSIICFSIPILIIIGIIVLVILFFVIRNIIRRTRQKIGFTEGAGNVIRQQLANFDQYVQNDSRQEQQWASSASPVNEPELDLDDIDVDDYPARPSTRREQPEPLPDWDADSLVCAACGAPRQPSDKRCTFCGNQH